MNTPTFIFGGVNLLRLTSHLFHHVLWFVRKFMDFSSEAIYALNISTCHYKVLLLIWQVSWASFLGVMSYLNHHLLDIISLDDVTVNHFNQLIVILLPGYWEHSFDGFKDGVLGYTIKIMNIGIVFRRQHHVLIWNLYLLIGVWCIVDAKT